MPQVGERCWWIPRMARRGPMRTAGGPGRAGDSYSRSRRRASSKHCGSRSTMGRTLAGLARPVLATSQQCTFLSISSMTCRSSRRRSSRRCPPERRRRGGHRHADRWCARVSGPVGAGRVPVHCAGRRAGPDRSPVGISPGPPWQDAVRPEPELPVQSRFCGSALAIHA